MAVRVAEEWLHSCSGCEIAILNIGEPLVELLAELEFVHIPVLMDNKYFGQLGDKEHLEIPEADVGIVCLHEVPYAEGVGDRADLSLTSDGIDLIQRVGTRCQQLVVIIFSGRPLVITNQLPLAEAWVAAWLPGTEAQGITDVIFGDYPPQGKLPYNWPRSGFQPNYGLERVGTGDITPLFPFGYGLR